LSLLGFWGVFLNFGAGDAIGFWDNKMSLSKGGEEDNDRSMGKGCSLEGTY
jgi:hypothetical protein